ncbi:MAG: carboxypeptidase regulatory-like domain-containing protein [Myxococcales bacterium]|nr:carboxypeptidase regulatory-like domain-containing protein [Myxococcales bacterium]
MTRRSLWLGACVLSGGVFQACTGGHGDPVITTATQTTITTTSSTTQSTGTGGVEPVPPAFVATGLVVDQDDQPVEGALVMQGGHDPDAPPALLTGPDGTFSIAMTNVAEGLPTVVAAKLGYRSDGFEYYLMPIEAVTLKLRLVGPPDNTGFVYGPPGTDMTDGTDKCAHCHMSFVEQFNASTHAEAARSPLVQALYAGVTLAAADAASCAAAGGEWRAGLEPGTAATSASKCYLGAGVLPDLNPSCGAPGDLACDDPALAANLRPTAFGGCADCHAPGMSGPLGGRNLHEATDLAYDKGVHCDFCHKVADIDLTKPAGVGQRVVVHRPSDTLDGQPGSPIRDVMFGAYPDVPLPFMAGSWQPKFGQSVFCAGCHEHDQPALVPGSVLDPARWPSGLPIQSTYAEWLASPYNLPAMQCHGCHMPPDPTLYSSHDITLPEDASIIWGFIRPPGDIRKHEFTGPLQGTPRLVDGVAGLTLGLTADAASVTVGVDVANSGAGHSIPTGEPMRALVLLVSAQACGSELVPNAGMTVSDVGGALAVGVAGTDVTAAGGVLTWAAGAGVASPGQVVRVVRPSGSYDDYVADGFFGNPALTPADKGMPILTPVGSAAVATVGATTVTLASALALQPGDLVYLGEAAAVPVDGADAPALAGVPGYTFSKVLGDTAGARNVPHYRASDIVSDNRIPAAATAHTTHGFAVPPGCTGVSATVTATVLYRPVPVGIGRGRGVPARDYVIATAVQQVAIP